MVIPDGTVFVLGAGASAAYGFPTGNSLLRTAANHLTSRPIQVHLLQAARASDIEAAECGRRLLDSGAASIDDFVRDNPSLSKLAKCVIAYQLFLSEQSSSVLPGSGAFRTETDWAGYLISNLLKDGLDRAPRVSFITFNFERSFERRIVTSFAARFHQSAQDSWQALAEKFRIIHVSGSLGDAEWVTRSTIGRAGWGGEVTAGALGAAADRLFFVHESRAEPPLAEAQAALLQSRLACFLGFGFHPSNLNAILPPTGGNPDADRHRRVIGSGFGLTKAEARQIEHHFAIGRGQLVLELSEGKDALSFLREHPNLHGNNRRSAGGLWE